MAESKDVIVVREDSQGNAWPSRTVTFRHTVDGRSMHKDKPIESTYTEYDEDEKGMELNQAEEGDNRIIHLRNMQARIEARNATAARVRGKGGRKDYMTETVWAAVNEQSELAEAMAGGPITLKAYLAGVRLQMNVAD